MENMTENKAEKNAKEKILAARVLAEKKQKEEKERRGDHLGCRSFDCYLIEELKNKIYYGERELEEIKEELKQQKQIVKLYEEGDMKRRHEFRKLHTEVTMELLLGLKSVLEDANKARDKVKEIPTDDAVATVSLMAVYADQVIKVGQALEKLMVY